MNWSSARYSRIFAALRLMASAAAISSREQSSKQRIRNTLGRHEKRIGGITLLALNTGATVGQAGYATSSDDHIISTDFANCVQTDSWDGYQR